MLLPSGPHRAGSRALQSGVLRSVASWLPVARNNPQGHRAAVTPTGSVGRSLRRGTVGVCLLQCLRGVPEGWAGVLWRHLCHTWWATVAGGSVAVQPEQLGLQAPALQFLGPGGRAEQTTVLRSPLAPGQVRGQWEELESALGTGKRASCPGAGEPPPGGWRNRLEGPGLRRCGCPSFRLRCVHICVTSGPVSGAAWGQGPRLPPRSLCLLEPGRERGLHVCPRVGRVETRSLPAGPGDGLARTGLALRAAPWAPVVTSRQP